MDNEKWATTPSINHMKPVQIKPSMIYTNNIMSYLATLPLNDFKISFAALRVSSSSLVVKFRS